MIRLAAPLCLATAAGAALFLFHVKHQVRGLEAELADVQRANLAHREAIHVLNSEWSYLNQPARIADLARRHLGLRPIPADRIVHLADLPPRPERAPDDAGDGSTSQLAVGATLASGTGSGQPRR